MTPSHLSLPSRDDQMTVDEALVAVRISRATLYRLMATGRVPAIRLGRSWRLHVDTVRHLAEHGLTDQAVA